MADSPLLYLVRHGQTDANVAARFAGWSDDHLNELGRRQCAQLVERLEADAVEAVYTSPVRRAVETAEILATGLGARIRTVHDLHEIEVGPWKGFTEEEVARDWPNEYAAWRDEPDRIVLEGRETLQSVQERALEAVDQIAHAQLTGSEAPAVVVSHLAVLRVLWLAALGSEISAYHSVTSAHCEVFPIRWVARGRIEPGRPTDPARPTDPTPKVG
jgi:broad specificity phosphatase PhoE